MKDQKSMNKLIVVKQIGSPIRRDSRQKLYLKSLGLGKMNRMSEIIDNESTRGLLDKLQHMVIVVS
jgi:large subunit ribosomal protein L30